MSDRLRDAVAAANELLDRMHAADTPESDQERGVLLALVGAAEDLLPSAGAPAQMIRPLGDELEDLARVAISNALALGDAGPSLSAVAGRGASIAADWSRTALHALEASRHVPATPGDMDEAERRAAAEQVVALREEVGNHVEFLQQLYRTFAEADTSTSLRLAARIQQHLAISQAEGALRRDDAVRGDLPT